MKKPFEDRFWEKVKKTPTCWLWQASVQTTGYGQIGRGGRKSGYELAHRASWIMKFGKIPEGKSVLHKCDTRRCVRPSHLFLGTQCDNMKDMAAKKRWNGPKGDSHPHAKLTMNEAKEIKRLLASGMICHRVAKRFGVNWTTISQIRDGKSWREA